MGNHVSKTKRDKTKTKIKPIDKSKISSSKTKLSSEAKPSTKPRVIIQNKPKFKPESRSLSQNNESHATNSSNTLTAKEASAKAAEERYQKTQQQKLGQNDRLRSKAKQSKKEKNL